MPDGKYPPLATVPKEKLAGIMSGLVPGGALGLPNEDPDEERRRRHLARLVDGEIIDYDHYTDRDFGKEVPYQANSAQSGVAPEILALGEFIRRNPEKKEARAMFAQLVGRLKGFDPALAEEVTFASHQLGQRGGASMEDALKAMAAKKTNNFSAGNTDEITKFYNLSPALLKRAMENLSTNTFR
jgi:hypothetical protein